MLRNVGECLMSVYIIYLDLHFKSMLKLTTKQHVSPCTSRDFMMKCFHSQFIHNFFVQ